MKAGSSAVPTHLSVIVEEVKTSNKGETRSSGAIGRNSQSNATVSFNKSSAKMALEDTSEDDENEESNNSPSKNNGS